MDFVKYLSDKHNINLNEQQKKAVLSIDGPILLLAVPGGGKTTVIVSRCANMVINHNINPDNILTLTFSKASALDMKHRFEKVFGNEAGNEMNFSTIHSFCYSVLKTYTQKTRTAFPVIIEDDKAPVTKNQLLRQLYHRFNNSFINDDKLEELSNAICYVKNMMFNDKEISNYRAGISNFYEIFKSYEDYKLRNNFMDFDDMLTRTLGLFVQNGDLIGAYRNRYKYINVDESQDTSYLQHQIIKCLANPRNNIFMVGDEDQSIYTFRAAYPRALLDFEKNYPGARVLLMESNYRSTKSIATAANIFIKQNKERYDKNMLSEREIGEPAKYICSKDRNEQYEHIVSFLNKEKDFYPNVVLYRNNVSAIPLADALNRNGIPFYLREAKTHFFKHWVTTDILSFMHLSFDGSDIEAFRQIYFKMNAYISKVMVEFAVERSHSKRNVFDILLEYPDLNRKQSGRIMEIKHNILKISRMTAHQAIEFIEGNLEYGEYLKRQSGDENEDADSLMQVLSGLKSIAVKTRSIVDFINRLEELQKIMDSAKFNKGKNAITLSTLHSSKGLEFDRVFIIDLFEGQFPSSASINEFDFGDKALMEEEVRLFYVGATRARHHLELMSARKLDGNKVRPSRFIDQFMSAYKEQAVKKCDIDRYMDYGTLSEMGLCPGMPVVHNKFGKGSIRFINPKADILEIFFDNAGLKTFSLRTCLSGNIINIASDT